ncbi:MAG TPA: hypothetical protein DEA55_02130, partial [Rhodospirillaceae bacterium]|nr:hypothetical protein [Rhodospirillaceae bacterium]
GAAIGIISGNSSSGTGRRLLQGPKDKTATMETMMTKGKAQMDRAAQDAASFGRDNAEAMMKFGQTFAKGFEEIMREAAAIAQTSAEKQAQFVKQAMSTKTLNEWAEVQNKMAQANFDDFMEGATKISELSVKLLTESFEPFSNQMNEVMKKAGAGICAA